MRMNNLPIRVTREEIEPAVDQTGSDWADYSVRVLLDVKRCLGRVFPVTLQGGVDLLFILNCTFRLLAEIKQQPDKRGVDAKVRNIVKAVVDVDSPAPVICFKNNAHHDLAPGVPDNNSDPILAWEFGRFMSTLVPLSFKNSHLHA